MIPAHWSQRNAMVPDLVKCYGAGGRTIIFCDTKRDANDLTVALAESVGTRALHGDIPQVRGQAHGAGLLAAPALLLQEQGRRGGGWGGAGAMYVCM